MSSDTLPQGDESTSAESPATPPCAIQDSQRPDAPLAVARAPWYRRGWVLGLIAVVVGLVVGAAAGAGNKPKAQTVTSPAQTVVHTVRVRPKTSTVVHVHTITGPTATVTQTVRETRAAPISSTPASTGGSGGQVYSGNGDKNFGTIVVKADSTLHWTCQCDPAEGFYLSSDPDPNSIDSIDIQQSGSSGTTAVGAGTYGNVKSIGNGQFSFYLSPG